jgi:hypothetical protein
MGQTTSAIEEVENATKVEAPTFLEYAQCPICNDSGQDLEGDVRTFVPVWNRVVVSRFRHCHACDYAWMVNPPSADSLESYYRTSDKIRRAHLTVEEAHHTTEQVRFLTASLQSHAAARHLEVGPDNGAFLRVLGLSTIGNLYFEELNETAAAALAAEGYRNAVGLNDVQFDSITLRHVFVEPVLYLKSLAPRLAERGVIFVEVPDYSTIGDGLSDLFQFEHVNYFSLSSLHKATAAAGFRIERAQFVRTPGYSTTPNRVMQVVLRQSIGAAKGATIDGWQRLLRSSWDTSHRISARLQTLKGQRIAIYGAGTLTMQLFAATPSEAVVSGVFDANPQKVGMPVLGVKVLPATAVDPALFDLLLLTVVGDDSEVRRVLGEQGVPASKIVGIHDFIRDSD